MPLPAVFVDIDGTLVPDTSSGQFLAERIGHAQQVQEAEEAYAAGRIDNAEVCRIDAAGWAGRTTAEVDAWLAQMPLIDGIQETVDALHALGTEVHLASLAWTEVGRHLAARFGFDSWCGSQLEVRDGVFTGRVLRPLDEHGKRDAALARIAALGADPADCAAIGDSRSDLPLFAAVGLPIALNAGADARAAARVAIDSRTLAAVLPHLEQRAAATLRGDATTSS